MFSRELFKNGLKFLDAFIPVHKPAGVCCQRLGEGIRLDIYFVMEHSGNRFGSPISLNYGRPLEPFAEGLMTYILGAAGAKRKNFVLADYTYRTVIEFGVEREHGCIDGPIQARGPVDHLSARLIESALPEFTGQVSQYNCTAYDIAALRQPGPGRGSEPTMGESDSPSELYNRMIVPMGLPKRLPHDELWPSQKYPKLMRERVHTVSELALIDFDPSRGFAEFHISCSGCFSVRRLALDLGQRLGTRASVIKLTRLREGPIHLEDSRVLRAHELHLDYYIHHLDSLKGFYGEFNAKMDPLWENIST